MADTDDVNLKQHLQMMIHKRNRCEDWVASVALREQIGASSEDKAEYVGVDYSDDYSDRIGSATDESVKRTQRKVVSRAKSDLNLTCEWRDCSFTVTTSRSSYFQHLTYHEAEVDDGYECQWESCNFATSERDQMIRHIAYHGFHTLLKALALRLHEQWDFPLCKIENENRNLLPDLPEPFECGAPSCGFRSNYFQSYLNHVDEHLYDLNFDPAQRKQAKCFWKFCVFKCQTRTRMKTHLRIHTGEKVAACHTCGATFATNTKYMDHCARKNPVLDESNRCQYCLRYFSNERLLRDHLRYHVNRHKCTFCEITCSTPSVLANHIRYKHIRERPFKCSECSYRSVKAEDCISHMSAHDTEPKYKCQAEGCRFACAAVQTFNNHFRSVHLKVDGPVYCCHLCDRKYKRGTVLGKHLRAVHQLERPPGHSRFRYMEGIDGNYRLQIERYESIETENVEVDCQETIDEPPNFIVKYEASDDKSCPTFVVTVDESQKYESGALIAIDEIDEAGLIVRTSTVREKIVELPSADSIFVDVGTPAVPVVTNELISDWDKPTSDSRENREVGAQENVAFRHYRLKKRRAPCTVLSDVDISRNVISLNSER